MFRSYRCVGFHRHERGASVNELKFLSLRELHPSVSCTSELLTCACVDVSLSSMMRVERESRGAMGVLMCSVGSVNSTDPYLLIQLDTAPVGQYGHVTFM